MERQPAVYILASKRNGTLYIGVTSDLIARVWAHRTDAVPGFTREYRVHTLVYFKLHGTMYGAITREKQLKKWRRTWKVELIEKKNPDWTDLWDEIKG
jgi:putative endonuclease